MNENTALRNEATESSLQQFIKGVAQAGFMTASDQAQINELAKSKLNHTDLMAINHLTALIRDGVVKVS